MVTFNKRLELSSFFFDKTLEKRIVHRSILTGKNRISSKKFLFLSEKEDSAVFFFFLFSLTTVELSVKFVFLSSDCWTDLNRSKKWSNYFLVFERFRQFIVLWLTWGKGEQTLASRRQTRKDFWECQKTPFDQWGIEKWSLSKMKEHGKRIFDSDSPWKLAKHGLLWSKKNQVKCFLLPEITLDAQTLVVIFL